MSGTDASDILPPNLTAFRLWRMKVAPVWHLAAVCSSCRVGMFSRSLTESRAGKSCHEHEASAEAPGWAPSRLPAAADAIEDSGCRGHIHKKRGHNQIDGGARAALQTNTAGLRRGKLLRLLTERKTDYVQYVDQHRLAVLVRTPLHLHLALGVA